LFVVQKDIGLLGGVDDIVAGVPDEVAELVGAEKFPDFSTELSSGE